MSSDPPDPSVDLSKLEGDYQILTELHRDGDTPTYLARHNGLNRDVTIEVVRAAGDRSYLEAFAQDAKILAEKRNAAIVPVIEGRWLDDHTFAIVRARVRGSTLDQLLSAIGTMPEPRVSSTLRQIAAALGWARANGVMHRRVSPQSVVFQQGSGRVLIALEPWPNPSDDVTTIRRLAARMTGGAPVDITEYLGLLSGGVISDVDRPPTIVETPVALPPVREESADTVVVQQRKSGMSFAARFLSALVVLAAVIVLAAVLIHRRESTRVNSTANGVLDSMGGEPAGESALHSNRIDTVASAPEPPVNPVIINPEPVSPAPLAPPNAAPPTPPSPSPSPSLPPSPQPRVVVPAPIAPPPATAPPATDTAVASSNGDVCSSSVPSDQHRCLMNAISSGDQALNSVYQRLIAALRQQAGAGDDAPDPPSVVELRSEERRWLEDRDAACHNAGDGPFYARDRAACYADRSTARTKELQARLDAM